MATRTNTVNDPTLLTSLGGTVNAADDVVIGYYGIDYTSGVLANDLLSFKITPGFNGSFQAANGGQLQLVVNQTSTGRFINEGNSRRVELTSTSSTGVIYNIENRPALAGGILQVNTCDTENVYNEATMYVEAAADVNNVFQTAGASFFRQTAAATTFPLGTVRLDGGSMELNRDVTTVHLAAARLTLNSTHVTPGTINCYGGSVLEPLKCGTITTLNGYDGVLDLRRLSVPITVSTFNSYAGFEIWVSRASAALVTFSATNSFAGGARTKTFD